MNNIKIEFKWAVIFSVMTLLWMTGEKLFGLHGKYIDLQMYLTNLYAIPAIVVMVLALRDKKKSFYQGQMSYKQGFLSGLILSVIIALISPLTQWVISNVISPEYFPNVIKRSIELGYFLTKGAAEDYFNYSNYAVQGVFGALAMGILTTAIAMIFIRTKK